MPTSENNKASQTEYLHAFTSNRYMHVHMSIGMYLDMHKIYIYICICICVYIYIYEDVYVRICTRVYDLYVWHISIHDMYTYTITMVA